MVRLDRSHVGSTGSDVENSYRKILLALGNSTALIPAFFGLVFAALGLAGRDERYREHVMHVAMVLAILATAGRKKIRGPSLA